MVSDVLEKSWKDFFRIVEQQCDLQYVKTMMYDNFHSSLIILLFRSVSATIMIWGRG